MEFLKKTWKFFLGVVVTILGTLLIFRKDDSGELIDKSTRAGNNALDKVIKSNATRKEKTAAAAENHELEVEKIRKIYEEKKGSILEYHRKKIEYCLRTGNISNATSNLSVALGVKNLDDVK